MARTRTIWRQSAPFAGLKTTIGCIGSSGIALKRKLSSDHVIVLPSNNI